MPLTYHPEAETDLARAAVFYGDRSPGLGDRFLDEFERAIRAIQTNPERWPVIQDDLRCFSLDHFPFGIYYRIIDDAIRILVIRHHKRHLITAGTARSEASSSRRSARDSGGGSFPPAWRATRVMR